jgi:thymidine kinase
MRFYELLLIAVGLSMDAFAAALCKGLNMVKPNVRHFGLIASFFGGFQAVMPLIGWLIGTQFKQYITNVDHWIAFALLAFIGGKMIYEFVKNKLMTMASVREYLKGDWRFVEFISCILVDEAQFMEPHHVDELAKIVNVFKIPVICYGLRSDFQTKAFPGSLRLFEIADEIEELITICRCGAKARFNARKINGEFVKEGAQVSIDGIDATYESMCRTCYMKYVQGEDGEEIAKSVKKSVEEPIN